MDTFEGEEWLSRDESRHGHLPRWCCSKVLEPIIQHCCRCRNMQRDDGREESTSMFCGARPAAAFSSNPRGQKTCTCTYVGWGHA